MSGRGVQDGDEQPSIARRVEELEEYCHPSNNDELTLEGLRERIEGIPSDAVRGSNKFFCLACRNERVTLEMIECLLEAFPGAARSVDQQHGWSPLHHACINKGVAALEIVECLLDAFPGAVRSMDRRGWSPLHCACRSKNPDPRRIRVLVDSWSDAVNHRDNMWRLPLHWLCEYGSAEETALLAIVDLLLDAAPDSATIVNGRGNLPIHIASRSGRPRSFCKRLIDAYPESLRVQTNDDGGCLPIHLACRGGNIETVKHMLELYPESIDARTSGGDLPIHCAANAGGVCLDLVRLLFDANPEAINVPGGWRITPVGIAREPTTPVGIARERGNDALVQFLQTQLAYARLAEDGTAMTTPDENGWLPLHHALRNNISLGAIKLLIAGNRDALQVSDNQSAFPLHIACEFSAVGVVEYLLGLSDNHLYTLDSQSNSSIQNACRGGNLGVAKCLLERGAPLVSEPDRNGKLPIHLLWESDRVDRDSLEYVDAVWHLLLAHPETVTH